MNAEFDLMTKLMEKVYGDKVETEIVGDRISDSQCFCHDVRVVGFYLLSLDHPSQSLHAVQNVSLARSARST